MLYLVNRIVVNNNFCSYWVFFLADPFILVFDTDISKLQSEHKVWRWYIAYWRFFPGLKYGHLQITFFRQFRSHQYYSFIASEQLILFHDKVLYICYWMLWNIITSHDRSWLLNPVKCFLIIKKYISLLNLQCFSIIWCTAKPLSVQERSLPKLFFYYDNLHYCSKSVIKNCSINFIHRVGYAGTSVVLTLGPIILFEKQYYFRPQLFFGNTTTPPKLIGVVVNVPIVMRSNIKFIKKF